MSQQLQRSLHQVGSADLIPVSSDEGEALKMASMTQVHAWQPSQVLVWFLMALFGVLLVVVLAVGMVQGWPTLLVIAPYVTLGFLGMVGAFVLVHLVDYVRHQASMKRLHERSAELDVQAKADEQRRANEVHATVRYLATWRLPADELGNRPFPFNPHTGEYLPIPSGNYLQPVPHTLHYDYRGTSTRVTEEPQASATLPPPVPSGRQLLLDGTVEQALASGYYLLGPSEDGKMKQIARHRLFSTTLAQDIRYTYWHSDLAEDSSCQDKLTCVTFSNFKPHLFDQKWQIHLDLFTSSAGTQESSVPFPTSLPSGAG